MTKIIDNKAPFISPPVATIDPGTMFCVSPYEKILSRNCEGSSFQPIPATHPVASMFLSAIVYNGSVLLSPHDLHDLLLQQIHFAYQSANPTKVALAGLKSKIKLELKKEDVNNFSLDIKKLNGQLGAAEKTEWKAIFVDYSTSTQLSRLTQRSALVGIRETQHVVPIPWNASSAGMCGVRFGGIDKDWETLLQCIKLTATCVKTEEWRTFHTGFSLVVNKMVQERTSLTPAWWKMAFGIDVKEQCSKGWLKNLFWHAHKNPALNPFCGAIAGFPLKLKSSQSTESAESAEQVELRLGFAGVVLVDREFRVTRGVMLVGCKPGDEVCPMDVDP